jgi:hypothetical protein
VLKRDKEMRLGPYDDLKCQPIFWSHPFEGGLRSAFSSSVINWGDDLGPNISKVTGGTVILL